MTTVNVLLTCNVENTDVMSSVHHVDREHTYKLTPKRVFSVNDAIKQLTAPAQKIFSVTTQI
ncbi:MAG: hypothetical protein NC548_05725 [Lachnospiraceae bacterium]|nr:hypothetical protein [Lachnospiraceae bacterium]